MTKEELTGYPNIDQPWKKYSLGEYEEPKKKNTVYQEVHSNNLDQPKTIALEFFDSKINFATLDENINNVAKSLEEYGIKKGDFVTVCAAGIPETVYVFYALSKIGAIANMISPFFDSKEYVNRIEDCESNMLIIMDKFYPAVKDAVKSSRIKNIIIVPTLNSSLLRFLGTKYKTNNKSELIWKKFINDGKNRLESKVIEYEKNMPLCMVYSSGTTGASKGILLSNDSFQNSVYAYRKSGVEVGRGFKFYQIIPPWYSTGLSTSIHLPLASGSTVFMDPRFERNIFIKNIIKHKPTYSVAPTSMYEGFLNEKLPKKCDLSFFKYPFEGGEPLRKEVSNKIENVFKNHNSNAKLLVGYGQCECGATITSESPLTTHKDGNVGIPLPGINLGIVDDSFNFLKYNERGQIIVDTKCGMLGYYKNDLANEKYFYFDKNGTKWYCTGDIGYIDSDGNLYILGRDSDCSIVNNKKIYNFDVENIIIQDPDIKLCDVLLNNNHLTAHLVFTDEFIKNSNASDVDMKLDKIQNLIFEATQDYCSVPTFFKIRDSFPYAKSGKRDTQKIMQETDGFIFKDYCRQQKKLLVK